MKLFEISPKKDSINRALKRPDLFMGFEIEFELNVENKAVRQHIGTPNNWEEGVQFILDYFPYEIEAIDQYSEVEWSLESESSIYGEWGYEITSPKTDISTGLEYIQNSFKWLEQPFVKTTSETGFHVHISSNRTLSVRDKMILVLLSGESYLLRLFRRTRNDHTSSTAKAIQELYQFLNGKKSLSKLRYLTPEFVDELKNLDHSLHLLLGEFLQEKWSSFRFVDDSHFEFRAIGNKGYEKQFPVIRRQILKFAWLMNNLDNTDILKDFSKKLNKIK